MVDAAPSSAPAKGQAARLFGLYLVGLVACLVGNLVIRLGARAGWLPPTGQAALGVAATVPMAIGAFGFWRLFRRDLDEMLQRIALEGMALAFVVFLPLSALFINLRTAGVGSPRLDATDLLFAPAVLLALGILVAWRRHQ